ncbi:membrane protein [Pantoea sp. BL1]|uniref:hypothetical protein n=1 Tax=Pantoea sp. BL1 TaxID=1628190 RepID=UPI0005F7EE2A|nr:hypothetical protein [Pantoea sp. BL1]KJV50157.1 membrane protein [Pantoea sp. BL1]
MKKTKKTLIYVLVVIIYFLIIPELILRALTSEQLARLSDFTSLGGIVNPLLSLLIFFGFFAVVLAIITVSGVSKLLAEIDNSEVR